MILCFISRVIVSDYYFENNVEIKPRIQFKVKFVEFAPALSLAVSWIFYSAPLFSCLIGLQKAGGYYTRDSDDKNQARVFIVRVSCAPPPKRLLPHLAKKKTPLPEIVVAPRCLDQLQVKS